MWAAFACRVRERSYARMASAIIMQSATSVIANPLNNHILRLRDPHVTPNWGPQGRRGARISCDLGVTTPLGASSHFPWAMVCSRDATRCQRVICHLRAPRARASYFQLAVTPLQRIRRSELRARFSRNRPDHFLLLLRLSAMRGRTRARG